MNKIHKVYDYIGPDGNLQLKRFNAEKTIDVIIAALNESQEPKALEEKPCCVAELGCLCPDENGMSEHNIEKCPCPEHYAKHEEWLRHLIAMAKPQDELNSYGYRDHTHCPEKDSPCGIDGKHRCCLCGKQVQDEPKKCPMQNPDDCDNPACHQESETECSDYCKNFHTGDCPAYLKSLEK